MTTENTEIDQEIDDVTLENNANGEQIIIEELSLEEQLTQDLAKEKDKYYDYLLNLKITNAELLKSVSSCLKRLTKKFYLLCYLF